MMLVCSTRAGPRLLDRFFQTVGCIDAWHVQVR